MRRLFADGYSEADQTLLDPTIPVGDRDGDRVGAVEIPAGWVPTVNRLHHDLTAVIGAYRVISASDKGGRLRYLIDRRDDAADVLIADARAASMGICSICGDVATPANPPRCERHPRRSAPHVIARPPGWSPPAA